MSMYVSFVVFFHTYRSLLWFHFFVVSLLRGVFMCIGLLSSSLYSYIQVSFHMFGSLFIRLGLFSYVQVSLHMFRSLFIRLGLFSYVQVSIHMFRSLFICLGLFSYVQVSFHTFRSLLQSLQRYEQRLDKTTKETSIYEQRLNHMKVCTEQVSFVISIEKFYI